MDAITVNMLGEHDDTLCAAPESRKRQLSELWEIDQPRLDEVRRWLRFQAEQREALNKEASI